MNSLYIECKTTLGMNLYGGTTAKSDEECSET